jgi:hypothetical protein
MPEREDFPGRNILSEKAVTSTRQHIWKENPEECPMPSTGLGSLKKLTVSRLAG